MTVTVDLDAPCGRYLTYRDFIECGKTWAEHARKGMPIDNLPRAQASLDGLWALAETILDPLSLALGKVELTYAFASPRLTRAIRRRIAPSLDQHSASEVGATGAPICARGGAAVDLSIPGRSATEVARWIAAHTAFDRMYLYGDARAIHISHSPHPVRIVVSMQAGPSGRLLPRRVRW